MEITVTHPSGLGGVQPFNVASFAVAHLKQSTTNPVKTHHTSDTDFGGIVRALAVANTGACDFYLPYATGRPVSHQHPAQPWIQVPDTCEVSETVAGPSGLMLKLERAEEEGVGKNTKKQKKGNNVSVAKEVDDKWSNCRYSKEGDGEENEPQVNPQGSEQTTKKTKKKKKQGNVYGAKMPNGSVDFKDLLDGDFEHLVLSTRTVSTCPICKMKFHVREELVVHMQVHLQNERLTNYSECPVCKCIVKDLMLLDHILSHVAELYVCPSCESSFATEQELRSHYEAHRDHLANQFCSCETCGEKCSDVQSYNRHLQKHMEKLFDVPLPPEKPKGERNGIRFTCTICGNSFAWRKGLKRHIVSVHAKIKDHGCPLCDKKFSRPEHLKRHLLRHTGEKPYQCETCGKSFIDRYSLSQHCRMHVRQQIARSGCSAEAHGRPDPC